MSTRTFPTHEHGTRLSQALGAARLVGGADVTVLSCTSQADCVRPGDAYVAFDADGQTEADARLAVERGAVAIVCERYLPVFGIPQYLVPDAPAAYSQLCHAILAHPSRELSAIGVAGSHGKTSVAMLLDSIFYAAGKSAATATNQFTRIDARGARFVLPSTAPAIAEFIDESLASGCRFATTELSDQALASKAADGAEFDVVCLTNLHSVGAVDQSPQAARHTMASALELLTPEGMAVLNADDSHCMRLLAEYDGPALTFGLHHPANVTATLVEQHVNEQVFLLAIGDQTAAVRTKVAGEAHVQNCLAAAAVATVYGISVIDIVRGLEQVEVVPGVMHRFDAGLGVSVFVDRGTAPIAMGGALAAARDVTTGRVVAVVDRPCQVTEALADQTIETEALPAGVAVSDAVARVLAAFDPIDDERLEAIGKKLAGIAAALLAADEGDVVVCCGLEPSRQPHPRRATAGACEQQLVQRLMYELAAEKSARDAA